jgi:lysozyme
MKPGHQVSRAAIELIKRFEGYRRKAAQLPDGRWTIGYGHTLSAREGAQVSEADAEALLLYDLVAVANTVSELVYAGLTQNQFDALCAFAFSIGLDAFRTCDVLKRVNEGAFTQAAFALELWRRAEFEGERIVIDALVRRRAAEKLLFLTPPNEAWRAVPSAVIRPEFDEDAVSTAPRGTPAEVVASLEGDAVEVRREGRGAEVESEAEPESPIKAAAEALRARFQTLIEEEQNGAAAAAASAPAEAETEAAPPPGEPELAMQAANATIDPELERALQGEPEPAAPVFAQAGDPPRRILIDDTAPYEFTPAPVQPIDTGEGDSLLGVVTLIVLGLAFFAGGVFWALNARPAAPPGVFTPLLVGWLAGVAGVGFLAVAVFMLLQRMTRAAERRDNGRF